MRWTRVVWLPAIVLWGAISALSGCDGGGDWRKEGKAATDRAIDALQDGQLDYGEFPTSHCENFPLTKKCVKESSPFISAVVVNALHKVDDPRVKQMKKKATSFFVEEQKDGLWSFWTSRHPRIAQDNLPPDLDDTSGVGFALESNNVSYKDASKIIKANKSAEGIYLTWISREKDKSYSCCMMLNGLRWPVPNDIDCVVNASIMRWYGKEEPKVCDFVNKSILTEKEDPPVCSKWYPSRLALYYTASRAYLEGIKCLGKHKDAIIKATLSYWDGDSFGNDLHTALAVNTLIAYGYKGSEVDTALDRLVERQKADGSWQKWTYFRGNDSGFLGEAEEKMWAWGSKELTTAVAIEALHAAASSGDTQ